MTTNGGAFVGPTLGNKQRSSGTVGWLMLGCQGGVSGMILNFLNLWLFTGGWMHGSTDGWVDDGWVNNFLLDEWMDGWMDGWGGGWMKSALIVISPNE